VSWVSSLNFIRKCLKRHFRPLIEVLYIFKGLVVVYRILTLTYSWTKFFAYWFRNWTLCANCLKTRLSLLVTKEWTGYLKSLGMLKSILLYDKNPLNLEFAVHLKIVLSWLCWCLTEQSSQFMHSGFWMRKPECAAECLFQWNWLALGICSWKGLLDGSKVHFIFMSCMFPV
jgi:hypothetical protein